MPHCKKCFLIFRNSCGYRLCPLPLVLMPGTTEKSLTAFLRTLPTGIPTCCWDPPEPSLLPAEKSQFSALPHPSVPVHHHPYGPSSDSPPYLYFSFVLGSPNVNTASQMWPHQSLETEKKENCWSGVLQGRLLGFCWLLWFFFCLSTLTAEEVRFRTTYTNMQEKKGKQKFIFTLCGSRGWEVLKPKVDHHLLATSWWENGDASQCHGRSLTRIFWPRAELTSSPQGQSPSALAWRQAQHH